jgi:hypothetical protein
MAKGLYDVDTCSGTVEQYLKALRCRESVMSSRTCKFSHAEGCMYGKRLKVKSLECENLQVLELITDSLHLKAFRYCSTVPEQLLPYMQPSACITCLLVDYPQMKLVSESLLCRVSSFRNKLHLRVIN